jgi:hypothetical protein
VSNSKSLLSIWRWWSRYCWIKFKPRLLMQEMVALVLHLLFLGQ